MQKFPFQFNDSLIKYEKPIKIGYQHEIQLNSQHPQGKASLRSILNVLVPHKIVSQQIDGEKSIFVQYSDEGKLLRNDIDILKQKMNRLLNIKKAKSQPICPIREEIFAEVFTQIIRQVVIDCPQRGIILNRVRNQAYLSIAAHRSLYEESLRVSKNKLAQSQNSLTALQAQNGQLINKQNMLKDKQMYLMSKKLALQQKSREIRTIYKEKRQHEMHSLSNQHQELQKFLTQVSKLRQQQELKQKIVIKKLQESILQRKEKN